jgi:hypothetical protein
MSFDDDARGDYERDAAIDRELLDRAEMPAPPAYAWREEEEPKTDVDAAPAPVLDLVVLANARRALGDAERLTAAGFHAEAIVEARSAFRKIALVLALRDRAALPLLSSERDTRELGMVAP